MCSLMGEVKDKQTGQKETTFHLYLTQIIRKCRQAVFGTNLTN